MCTPALVLTAAATAIGAVGQVRQARAQSDAAKYSAQVSNMNAQIEEKKSRDTLRRGQLEEQKKRMQVAGIKGQQLAAMGANNVDVSFGSPMETVIDTATLGEIDALTVRTNAHREAYDYRVQAANDRAQASMYKMAGKQALTGGYLAAAGTVVAGAGDAWGKFSSMAGGGGGFGGGGAGGLSGPTNYGTIGTY